MSIYSAFKTDSDLEVDGFALEIMDGTKVTTFVLARSGGANKAFTNELQMLMRPYSRSVSSNNVSDEVARSMTCKAMAKHVVLAWENVRDENEEQIEYTPESCEKLLLDLPDLADFLLREANNISNFLQEDRADSAKD